MNLELLDPWQQEYPNSIEESLEDGYILNAKFNRRGTLLAAGCLDGRSLIYDFDTKGISRSLIGHVKSVVSVSWSRNGRYLLSASKDWTCIFWDLIPGIKHSKIRFDTPLMMAQMHPKKNFQFVAALFQDDPVLVNILEDGTIQKTIIQTDTDELDEKAKSSYVCSVSWNKTGNKIYAGTSKGYLYIIDAQSLKVTYATKITSTSIKGIQWSNNGKDMLINANDRVLRLYQLDDHDDGIPVLQNKFQDLVNRVQWNQGCFSSDGEFVIGGSGHKAEHNIYIWDKKIGNLVKILEGPNEPLDDLTWHPGRPIIGSVSSYGNIHLWTTKHEENWSAFAPDFTELEENLEYDEKEDEFDVVPHEEMSKRKQDDGDILIDVTTCDPIHAFLDSDDDDEENKDEVFYLPSLPFDETNEYLNHFNNNNNNNNNHSKDNNNNNDNDDDDTDDHLYHHHHQNDIPTTPTSSSSPSTTNLKKKSLTKKLYKRNDHLDNNNNRSTKKLKKSSFVLF